jgi:hypothetical protein
MRARAIRDQLTPEQRPAYFQLVQYPVAAAAAMAEKIICAERSRQFAARGDRAAAGPFADRAVAAYRRIEELTAEYNQQLEGKWRHMMNHRPRKLPVFYPPVIARVEGSTVDAAKAVAATAASTQPRPVPAVVAVDIARPERLSSGDVRWTVLEGIGRRGAAIAPFPRTAKIDRNSADVPVAEYAIDIPAGSAEEYEVVVEALPTQPLTPRHGLVCAVSIDDQPQRPVTFQQASDERDRTWQQNVLRNAMFGRTKLRAKPGRHVLKLWALDPSVAVQHVMLNLASSPEATPAAATTSAPATSHSTDASRFAKKLPEGNYLVTIAFGSDDRDSETTVKAESRRLMLERVAARAGETVTRTFAVNIRTPRLADGGSVRLNAREKDAAHWDDQLTLEFLGDRAAVRSVDVKPAPPQTITVYLAGDRPAERAVISLGPDAAALFQAERRRREPRRVRPRAPQFPRGETARKNPRIDQAGRLPVHPVRAQRHEGERRGRRRVHELQGGPEEIHRGGARARRAAGRHHIDAPPPLRRRRQDRQHVRPLHRGRPPGRRRGEDAADRPERDE